MLLSYFLLILDPSEYAANSDEVIPIRSNETVQIKQLLTHNFAVIVLVFPQEPLRVVVGVNVDLGNGIVSGWLSDALVDT